VLVRAGVTFSALSLLLPIEAVFLCIRARQLCALGCLGDRPFVTKGAGVTLFALPFLELEAFGDLWSAVLNPAAAWASVVKLTVIAVGARALLPEKANPAFVTTPAFPAFSLHPPEVYLVVLGLHRLLLERLFFVNGVLK
jgi:hypothetical protein